MKKRILSAFLSLVLLLTLLPTVALADTDYATTYNELLEQLKSDDPNYITIALLPSPDFGWPKEEEVTLDLEKTVWLDGDWTIPDNVTVTCKNDFYGTEQGNSVATVTVAGKLVNESNTNIYNANIIVQNGGTLTTNLCGDASAVTVQNGGTLTTPNASDTLTIKGSSSLTMNKGADVTVHSIGLAGTLTGNDITLSCPVAVSGSASAVLSGTLTLTDNLSVGSEYGTGDALDVLTIPAGSNLHYRPEQYKTISVNNGTLIVDGTLDVGGTATGRIGALGFGANGSMTLGDSATVTMHYPYEITCQSTEKPASPYITGDGAVVYACENKIVERYCLFDRDISGHDWPFDVAKEALVPNYLNSSVTLNAIADQGTAVASSLYVGNTALMINGTVTGGAVSGASYDADTNTLTLSDVDITDYYTIPEERFMDDKWVTNTRAGIYYSGSETLHIVLTANSNNSITLHPSYDTTNGYIHAVGIYADSIGSVAGNVEISTTTAAGAELVFKGAELTAADTYISEKDSTCTVKAESIYVLGNLVLQEYVRISEQYDNFTVSGGEYAYATTNADATVFVRDNLKTRSNDGNGPELTCQKLRVGAHLFIDEGGAVTADNGTAKNLELYDGTATFTHLTVTETADIYDGTLTVNDMTAKVVGMSSVNGSAPKLIVKDNEQDTTVKGKLTVSYRAKFSAGIVSITSTGNAGIISPSGQAVLSLVPSNCTISGTAQVIIDMTGNTGAYGVRIGGALTIQDSARVTVKLSDSGYGTALSAYGGVTISGSPVVDLTGGDYGISPSSANGSSAGDVSIAGGTVTMICGDTGFNIARGNLTVTGGSTTVSAPNPVSFYNLAQGDSGQLTVSDGVLTLNGTSTKPAVTWRDDSGTAAEATDVPTPVISVATTPASLKVLKKLVNGTLIAAYTEGSETELAVDGSMNITNALKSITFGANLCPNGHTPVTDAAVAATCTTTGKTEGSHCSVCGAVIQTQTIIDALGHNYTDVVTPPTCTAQGYTTHTCTRGDDVKKDTYTPALGHDYAYSASGAVITETCSHNCGHSATATVSVTGSHIYTGVAQTPATVAYSTGWAGTKPDAAYTNNTNAGSASASITCEGETASVSFTISAADYTATPSVTSGSITVGAATGPDLTITATGKNGETNFGTLDKWYSDSACTNQISNFSAYAVGDYTIYWKYTASNPNYISAPKTGSYALTVEEGAEQNLTWNGNALNTTYGTAIRGNTATNSSEGGGVITYSSSNTAVATVNSSTGALTIVGAGTANITATAAAVTGKYRETAITYPLTVSQKKITVTVTPVSRKFGERNPAFEATVTSGTLVESDSIADLGLGLSAAATATSNVGRYDVTGDGSYNANYKVTVEGGTDALTVTKADARTLADIAVSQKYTVTSQQSKSVAGLMPADAGTLTYAKSSSEVIEKVTSWAVDSSSGNVTFTLNGAAGDSVTLPVVIGSTNYADSTVNLVVTLTDKDVPTVSANAITVTYTGSAVPASAITGTATFGSVPVAGTWSWKTTNPAQALTAVADSGIKTVVFTPNDTNTYAAVETTLTLTINKATPTGTPKYTAISEASKTLADAALTTQGGAFSTTGSVKWVDASGNDLADNTVVTANTAYRWLFTPSDTTNYNTLTGSVTLYSVYSGGGGGSASTPATTTPEVSTGSGSATATVDVTGKTSGSTTTAAVPERTVTGAITAAVDAAGSGTAAVEIKIDTPANADSLKVSLPSAAMDALADSKAETLTITSGVGEIAISSEAAASIAQQAGRADVTVTIAKVDTEKTLNDRQQAAIGDAPVFDLSVTANGTYISEFDGGLMTVTLPYALKSGEDPAGVAVWYMDENGNIEKLRAMYDIKTKTVVFTTNHFSLYVVGYDELAAMENPFTDVADTAYYIDAVKWAVYKGVTAGTGATTFAPNATCTRAQTVAFLWRAMGSPEPTLKMSNPFADVSPDAYYYKAVLWAVEKGVTSGTSDTTFSPDATVTRAQTVTFLWRAAEKPVVNYAMAFTDVPTDAYYTKAVRWAVSEGITSGTGATTFSPTADCTRAQIVTLLFRYLK